MQRKPTLWTRNYKLITFATALGAVGGIMARFALSFLVFDETGSTLAAGFLLAVEMLPQFLVPLVAAPRLDRMPRKPFLVGGDIANGALYTLAGAYLLRGGFSYGAYLVFSLVLSSLGAFDALAYNSLYPKLIPEQFEQKGYAVSSMLYPTLSVVIMPIGAILYEKMGVAAILLAQGALSMLAAAIESRIDITETDRRAGGKFSVRDWLCDLRAGARYLKNERGLQSIFAYMAVTNGMAAGYSPLLVAFFRTAPGMSVAMYSAFSVAEFLGRTLGGAVHYRVRIPPKKRFSFAFFVYQLYELMDMALLWLPYPLMLVNRATCGFLGVGSATLRQAAVQRYIPDEHRAKLSAFDTVFSSIVYGLLGLAVGALGEVLDYRLCMTVCGAFAGLFCWATIFAGRAHVKKIYNRAPDGETQA